MAAPIVYGQVQIQTTQGKSKLMATVTPRVKVAVNKFDGNNAIYIHINSRNKAISLNYEEYEELCNLKDNLDKKIHLLHESSQQISLQQQSQGQALQILGQNQAQLMHPPHQMQGQAHLEQVHQVQVHQGQAHQVPAHQGQAHHGQIQVAMPNIWDDIQFM